MENTVLINPHRPANAYTARQVRSVLREVQKERSKPEKPAPKPEAVPQTEPEAQPHPISAPTTFTPAEAPKESPAEITEEPPRSRTAQRAVRRSGIPIFQIFAAIMGTAAGVFFALSAPAGTDFTESILCADGEFLPLLLQRLLWGGCFLLAEYVLGYFALGRALVWAAPLVCGLGTGAALSGAFTLGGIGSLKLLPTCLGICLAVILGAGTSGMMSSQLLRLISTDKNSIVATDPAAGEYTLRFLVYFTILSVCAVAESALRTL